MLISNQSSTKLSSYFIFIIVTGVLYLFCSNTLKAGRYNDDQTGIKHPSIIWSNEDTKKIKEHIPENKYLSALNTLVISTADEMTELKPVHFEKEGKRLLNVSRTCLKRVIYLAYSYRITGDSKYLEKAEAEMLAAASFDHWNPSHFLDVAEMTMALGIGYDWLYNSLDSTVKNEVESAIVDKGLRPSLNGDNWWLDSYHNWNQVCNGGLTIGALAVQDAFPELADSIIERALVSLRLPESVYSPDGVYPEGPSYWNYGTIFHILFIEAYRSIYPGDDYTLNNSIIQSGQYILHAKGPAGFFNYADSGIKYSLSPAIFWFAFSTRDLSLLYHQEQILRKVVSGDFKVSALNSSHRFLPFILIWSGIEGHLDFPAPAKESWTGRGENPVSMHRTSWDDEAIFFGIKGGSPRVNHGHMDIGSFVMDAQGVRWALDLGGHGYHALESQGISLWDKAQDGERWTIFRYSNHGHNTLVVNEQLQHVKGHGEIIKDSSVDSFRYAMVDLSGVYEGQLDSVVRGMAIINNKYVKIRDEIINSSQESHVRWAMITHDDIEIINEKTAIIYEKGKKLTFHIRQPENANIEIYSTDPGNKFEEKNPGTLMMGFSIKLKNNEKCSLEVLLLPFHDILEEMPFHTLSEW